MRTAYALPLLLVFGCAHQSSETASSTETMASNQEAPPSQPQKEQMTQTETPPKQEAVAQTDQGMACPLVRVHFAFDSADIEDADKPKLDEAAACLRNNERQRVSIEGNTDERGPAAYNLDLGQKRADAVVQYLHEKGASATQIQAVVSHGEEKPLCKENDEDCFAKNRRTAVRATCHL